MKRVNFLLGFTGAMILCVNTGCEKESPGIRSGSTQAPANPPSLPPNRPPEANAGVNFSIVLFNNEMTLKGQATDPDIGNTLTTTWTKIAGPACTIVSPQSLVTNVSNLVEGVYQFEFLVSDNYGLTSRDTVSVRAVNIGSLTNPVNFFNLSWTCPMGCTISIPDIYSHIPSNTPIRVFIKFVNQANWYEVAPINQYSLGNSIYFYQFQGSSIVLYTETDMSINADVRILF